MKANPDRLERLSQLENKNANSLYFQKRPLYIWRVKGGLRMWLYLFVPVGFRGDDREEDCEMEAIKPLSEQAQAALAIEMKAYEGLWREGDAIPPID